jgi:TPR repeat protein
MHRHLTPEQIEFDGSWNPKVVDFAFSKIDKSEDGALRSQLSFNNAREYVAPEAQNGGNQYEKSVDVFSYGMIVYNVVTGLEIWPGLKDQQKAGVEKDERPDIPPTVKPGIRNLITSCWDRVPNNRPYFVEVAKFLYGDGPAIPIPESEMNAYIGFRDKRWEQTLQMATPEELEIINRPRVLPDEKVARFNEHFEKANNGDTFSMVEVGFLLLNGIGCERSVEHGMNFWKLAADKGDRRAMFNLGMCYREGREVPASLREALEWFTKSASLNLPDAMLRQARILIEGGPEVPPNLSEARRILTALASRNPDEINGEAHYSLGEIYRKGLLDPSKIRDYYKAKECYEAGFRNGCALAGVALANCLLKGNGCAPDVHGAMAMLLRILYCPSGRSQAAGTAALNLGAIWESGDLGVPRDFEKAFENYETGVRLGNHNCFGRAAHVQFRMAGLLKERAAEMMKHHRIGVNLLKEGAEQGASDCMHTYGVVLRDGKYGVVKNVREAISWFEKAAENAQHQSLVALGALYESGAPDLEKDLNKAREYYCRAVQEMMGDPSASTKVRLGLLYETGVPGIEKDLGKAVECFRAAGPSGATHLARLYSTS